MKNYIFNFKNFLFIILSVSLIINISSFCLESSFLAPPSAYGILKDSANFPAELNKYREKRVLLIQDRKKRTYVIRTREITSQDHRGNKYPERYLTVYRLNDSKEELVGIFNYQVLFGVVLQRPDQFDLPKIIYGHADFFNRKDLTQSQKRELDDWFDFDSPIGVKDGYTGLGLGSLLLHLSLIQVRKLNGAEAFRISEACYNHEIYEHMINFYYHKLGVLTLDISDADRSLNNVIKRKRITIIESFVNWFGIKDIKLRVGRMIPCSL